MPIYFFKKLSPISGLFLLLSLPRFDRPSFVHLRLKERLSQLYVMNYPSTLSIIRKLPKVYLSRLLVEVEISFEA